MFMIPRTILSSIEESIRLKPVTLITGARRVGKTTICRYVAERHGFGYVSLADYNDRMMAVEDPHLFLSLHPAPVIIDEIQYAPRLFDLIEGLVDKRKYETGSNNGMYVLAGNHLHSLMQGVTQSMAGRVSIIRMSPLSLSEILGREEVPFEVDFGSNVRRAMGDTMAPADVYRLIQRGSCPELYDSPDIRAERFYSDYVNTFLERDVPLLIKLKDQMLFRRFMEYAAALTGQELVYERMANRLGVSIHTVQSWMGVLVAGGIVHLLQPYFERSDVKRLTKRPKLYFCDTGLACYLSRVYDPESLMVGYHRGPFVETFMVNEIMKSYSNNTREAGFYYYRDSAMNEIDLVMHRNARLTLIECKAGTDYDATDVRAFSRLEGSAYEIGPSCLMCLTERAYPIRDGVYALPVTSI